MLRKQARCSQRQARPARTERGPGRSQLRVKRSMISRNPPSVPDQHHSVARVSRKPGNTLPPGRRV
ncbi:hypothetical protein BD309DRAFT_951844 [Dichomitus squalens]|uniref:Uncharacterized protein n=1 Tax=Dichomitus squalens TaxID=114155 RepID=A0A4Q9P5Y3_9APHY|nr:hypothetical protein BD309DRAFT_951844 [Dichomitus squalens]TBU57671.1 hypothetical protein BD310DRAFT_928792 [Dichomitus squalens]